MTILPQAEKLSIEQCSTLSNVGACLYVWSFSSILPKIRAGLKHRTYSLDATRPRSLRGALGRGFIPRRKEAAYKMPPYRGLRKFGSGGVYLHPGRGQAPALRRDKSQARNAKPQTISNNQNSNDPNGFEFGI